MNKNQNQQHPLSGLLSFLKMIAALQTPKESDAEQKVKAKMCNKDFQIAQLNSWIKQMFNNKHIAGILITVDPDIEQIHLYVPRYIDAENTLAYALGKIGLDEVDIHKMPIEEKVEEPVI